MSRDLERQLEEMGPAYRTVVARLRAAREVEPGGQRTEDKGQRTKDSRQRRLPFIRRSLPYLVAATLLVLLGFGVLFLQSNNRTIEQSNNSPCYTVRVTDAQTEYTHAELRGDELVKELIRTQNPDGSWKDDALTRRNAEVLRTCRSVEAQAAYRKAIDNLRSRGLL